MLRLATVSGARNNITEMPKFDGFQICRPLTRSTYLDVMEISAAQCVRPEGRRANQNANADAGDISAGGMRPFVKENTPEHKLQRDAGGDRQQSFLIAFENAERQMADQQNACDESRRDVAVVELEQRFSRGWR